VLEVVAVGRTVELVLGGCLVRGLESLSECLC
jgi:hypothetical protein